MNYRPIINTAVSNRFEYTQTWEKLIIGLIGITFFTYPLSATLRSILIPLTLTATLAYIPVYTVVSKIAKEPLCIATLLLFLILLLGCSFGEANWKYKVIMLNKYSKLLCMPILALAFQKRELRDYAVHAFLVAMMLTLCLSLLKIGGILNFHSSHAHSPADIFNNHIVTGFLMAFAAYLAAWYCKKSTGIQRVIYTIAAVLFSFHTLYINTGRTGYVIYGILATLFLFQFVPLRKLPFYFLLLIPLTGLVVLKNPILHERIQIALSDIKQYEAGQKDTSLGFRLQFHHYAKKLFLSHPIQGVGTGGFSYHFDQEKPIARWEGKLLDPHHQYWLIAAENGILGELCLLYFFFSLCYLCRKIKETRPIMLALLFIFLIANFIDSFLLFSSTGYLLILFAAMGIGESFMLSEKKIQNQQHLEEKSLASKTHARCPDVS